MGKQVADKNLDYIAGLLRSQIGVAQDLQSSSENDQLDNETTLDNFQMLSRLNRQIIGCYELLQWPMIRKLERSAD